MIMHHIPLHRVMGFDFIRKQAGRKQHQKETIRCNLALTRSARLPVRACVSDVWGTGHSWKHAGGWARPHAPTEMDPQLRAPFLHTITQQGFHAGYQIPAAAAVWPGLTCGFILNALPLHLYYRWVWSKFWVLVRVSLQTKFFVLP